MLISGDLLTSSLLGLGWVSKVVSFILGRVQPFTTQSEASLCSEHEAGEGFQHCR